MKNNTAGVWVSCSDKPAPNEAIIRRIRDKRPTADWTATKINPESFEWLDTKQPTFTLDDMKESYFAGKANDEWFHEYILRKFSIDT